MRYAKVWSESDYHANRGTTPSTDRQFDMARLLVEELHGLGIDNAFMDDTCYVYASVPATPGCEHLPAIGLIAHMDTTPDMTGKDVKPQVLHYEGGDLVLNQEQNIVMKAAAISRSCKSSWARTWSAPTAPPCWGPMTRRASPSSCRRWRSCWPRTPPTARSSVGFTPDEEIGLGASNFDVKGFGADFAYTLDGGDITDYEYETFNAAKSVVTVHGFSIHPGTSKDRMKNALLIAMEYNALLPALETPAHTEGYEGFFHLQEMHGKVEEATMEYIIRDHSMERFRQRNAAMDAAAEQINRRYGARHGDGGHPGPVLQHVRGSEGSHGDRGTGGGGHEGRGYRQSHPLPHPRRHGRLHADLPGAAVPQPALAPDTMPTAALSMRRWSP